MLSNSDDRWEHGSDFHLLLPPAPETTSHPWSEQGRMYASGRDAFHALIKLGRLTRGWRRLFVPSFYCQHVVASLQASGIEVCLYEDGPGDHHAGLNQISYKDGDAILVVHFFGLEKGPDYRRLDRMQVEIVEDHTHDPWSEWAYKSEADWCVASLRKTLPLPDGGVLWSPAGIEPLPPARLAPDRSATSSSKLSAMLLKALYLKGYAIDKQDFRALSVSVERELCIPSASGMTPWSAGMLNAFPALQMRQVRRRNFDLMLHSLRGAPNVSIMPANPDTGSCPFSVVMQFDSRALRDAIRSRLLQRQIYPAVLWPLDTPAIAGVPERHRSLSDRLLSLHCDIRYSGKDLMRVADIVRAELIAASKVTQMTSAEQFTSNEMTSPPCK